MKLADGWANLNSIKSAGKSLCYYVTGKFNIINFTTNVVVLGRLDAPMVAKLGPIGDLSANKILSYIPKFGNATAQMLNLLTANPEGEKTSAIPALTNGSSNYKDFKVVFNGGLESKNSIKSLFVIPYSFANSYTLLFSTVIILSHFYTTILYLYHNLLFKYSI